MNIDQQQQVGADVAAGGSAILAGVTWMADLSTLMQIGATGVAMIAGLAAAWWHIERIRITRLQRQKLERELENDRVDNREGDR